MLKNKQKSQLNTLSRSKERKGDLAAALSATNFILSSARQVVHKSNWNIWRELKHDFVEKLPKLLNSSQCVCR